MIASQDASALLANWASGVSGCDIPAHVRAIAGTCVIDTIGVAMAGTGTPVAGLARQFALQYSPPGRSMVLGARACSSMTAAAFCNAAAAHALDFDDNCYAGFVHGSAVIIPAALAVSQELNATGAELISAIVAGAECEYAVGAAAGVALYEKGWWTTGLLGPIGAGVAAGRLLGLDAEAMQSCIGFAVASAGGTKSCFGTDAKALMAGEASEAGLRWALMALKGARGPLNAFSHAAGFIRLQNDSVFDIDEIARVGRDWRLIRPGIDIKKYPVCLSSHAAIDVVSTIVSREGIEADQIDQIICDVPPVVVANLKYVSPKSVREAQFSMQFAAAAAVCFGTLSLDHLQAGIVQGDLIQSLMPRILMVSSAMWDSTRQETAPEGASVSLFLKDGRRFSGSCSHASGTAANPMSMEEVESKFLRCAGPILGARSASRLLQSLKALDVDMPIRGLLEVSAP